MKYNLEFQINKKFIFNDLNMKSEYIIRLFI